MITKQTATVYHNGKRRFFSLKNACVAAANDKIKQRCNCSWRNAPYPDEDYFDICHYHDNAPRLARLVGKLSRFYMREFRRQEKGGA